MRLEVSRLDGGSSEWTLYHHDVLPSTQPEAERLLKAGHAAPFVVMAHAQTQGRGQWQRPWHSPSGHFYASLALTASPWPQPLGYAALVGGLAVLHTIRSLSSGAGEPTLSLSLKWPNDVLIQGQKVAGILCDMYDAHHMIMGIGVNLAPLEEGHPPHATSLHHHGIVSCTPSNFLEVLLPQVQQWLQCWLVQGGDILVQHSAQWGLKRDEA